MDDIASFIENNYNEIAKSVRLENENKQLLHSNRLPFRCPLGDAECAERLSFLRWLICLHVE